MSATTEHAETITPERIRLGLALHRVKAAELAKELGLHPTALSRVLNEREAASADLLERLYLAVLALAARRPSAGNQ